MQHITDVILFKNVYNYSLLIVGKEDTDKLWIFLYNQYTVKYTVHTSKIWDVFLFIDALFCLKFRLSRVYSSICQYKQYTVISWFNVETNKYEHYANNVIE